MEKANEKPIRGIHIKTLIYVMILISCILYAAILVITVQSVNNYRNLVERTNDYMECESSVYLMREASDFLTKSAQLYTLTADTRYRDEYFEEALVAQRREISLSRVGASSLPKAVYNHLSAALSDSNQLMELEYYAMKLMVEATKESADTVPPVVAQTALSPEDRRLSPEDKLEYAQEIMFGPDYQSAKAAIIEDINESLNNLMETTVALREDSVVMQRRTIFTFVICSSLLFLGNVGMLCLMILYVFRPLRLQIERIKNNKLMTSYGAYEICYLSETFNNLYRSLAASDALLREQRHMAAHDALTGIMNRAAFDEMREMLSQRANPVALIMIDVDYFKTINDNFGHETGDHVLQKVAKQLDTAFRDTDFPARIGGDEFAVILTNITENAKETVRKKVASINEALSDPSDGLPAVTISAGVTFSQDGFKDTLYQEADTALYSVKHHGRHDCRFYDELDESEKKGSPSA